MLMISLSLSLSLMLMMSNKVAHAAAVELDQLQLPAPAFAAAAVAIPCSSGSSSSSLMQPVVFKISPDVVFIANTLQFATHEFETFEMLWTTDVGAGSGSARSSTASRTSPLRKDVDMFSTAAPTPRDQRLVMFT